MSANTDVFVTVRLTCAVMSNCLTFLSVKKCCRVSGQRKWDNKKEERNKPKGGKKSAAGTTAFAGVSLLMMDVNDKVSAGRLHSSTRRRRRCWQRVVPALEPAARAEAGRRDGASGEPQTTTEDTTHSSLSSSPKHQ